MNNNLDIEYFKRIGGKPLEIIGGGIKEIEASPVVKIQQTARRGSDPRKYYRMTVSAELRHYFKDKRFEIVDLGRSFALVPAEDGRFRLSTSTICGINTDTILSIKEALNCEETSEGETIYPAERLGDSYVFPHISIRDSIE